MYSDSESEFEDGLHSEYAPQGAPQATAWTAQEPAMTKKNNKSHFHCVLVETDCNH